MVFETVFTSKMLPVNVKQKEMLYETLFGRGCQ
jgi:hypothetical protein